MQRAIIVQSNGSGKEDLDDMLEDGWRVKSVSPNDGQSYNDFLIIVEKQ